MDLPPSPARPGWRRFFTERVVRILAAVGVVVAAAVIVPTLTSQPRRDEEALRTQARSSTSVDLNDDSADVSLELPSELTTVPATDGTKGGKQATSTTAQPSAPGDGSASTTRATSSTNATGTTVTTTGPSVTVPSTTATTQAGSCSLQRDTGAEGAIASLFEQRRGDMRRSSSMDATARSWACEMAKRQVAEHMSPFSPNRTDQIFAACRPSCSSVAENVAFNGSADAAWQGWLASPTHLTNIDAPGSGTYGIAAYRNGASIYFVHVFSH